MSEQKTEGTDPVPIPPAVRDAIDRYIRDGTRPGHFTQAMLENDLRGAFANADSESILAIHAILEWLHHHAPSTCWGNPEKVAAWIERGDALSTKEAI